MDSVITRFVTRLKRSGLSIAPSETMDALRALAHAGLADRETVRTVLCSTLIKDTRDIPLFDEQFDAFFRLPHFRRATAPEQSDEEQPLSLEWAPGEDSATPEQADAAAQADVTFDPTKLGEMFNPAHDPDGINFAALAQQLVLQRSQEQLDEALKPVYQVQSRAAPPGAQPGTLSLEQALAEVDLDLVRTAIAELLDDLQALEIDAALLDQLTSQIDALQAQLPALVASYLRSNLPQHQDDPADPSGYDYRFTEDEQRAMTEIIQRLGRQMRGALAHRRTVDYTGRINVAQTIRSSMKYDGIPFVPVLARRQDERPRLVVICDISLSVRHTARFMLHLLYSLQALFTRVRSFVFVSDLAEVSALFERLPLDTAIGQVFSGAVIDPDANSNYGRALELFYEQHRGAITPRTTVLILGDARGNRNPPNAWVLEALRRRARQLIWLTPEARGTWQLAGSDMPTYAPICHRVEVVRNLDQLGEVAADLGRMLSR
jgi:hypothetical protein